MLIDSIRQDPTLSKFLCEVCSENNVAVAIDETINKNDIVILKVDDFYNKNVVNPNCSPDCLIIQRCGQHFDIYIIELKNIKGPTLFTTREIKEKFLTCLDDFMCDRFGNYFHSEDIKINKVKLYFIADPYGYKKNPDKQKNYSYGQKLDFLMSLSFPKFFNKHIYIEPHLPDPMIKNCRENN